jgi:Major Facilitator Superfamily
MIASFQLLFGNPALRVLALILLLTGVTIAATQPYVSVVGIHELGMSNTMLSVFLFMYALTNLTVGVTISIFSDMVSSHRRIFMLTSLAGLVGFGSVFFLPSIAVFVLMNITLIPISNAANGLVFSTLRKKTTSLDSAQTGTLITSARTISSAAWILIPGIVGLILVNSKSTLAAWGISALAALASLVLTALFMTDDKGEQHIETEKVTFFASLKMIFEPAIVAQVICMAMVMASQRLSVIVSPLILLESAHGKMTDIGFLAGAIAFLEIPFMLMWGSLLKRFSTLFVLSSGAGCFCLYLLLLGFATETWHFYALLLPNACGAAAILSLPMVYFQDLLRDRPGLGTSLYQSNVFVSNGVSAATFAIGSSFLTYSQTVWLGMALAAGGLSGLFLARQRR